MAETVSADLYEMDLPDGQACSALEETIRLREFVVEDFTVSSEGEAVYDHKALQPLREIVSR